MEAMSMQKLSNMPILKVFSTLLILLVIAKVISLVVLYILPNDGVELTVEESYQPKYQRIDFKNMLQVTKLTTQNKKEKIQSGVSITNMLLKGLYGTDTSGFIIVALKSKPKDTSIIEVGEVYSGYTLVQIKKRSAIFTKNSTRFTLNLEDDKLDEKLTKSSAVLKADDDAPAQKLVSRNDIDYYAKNPKQIWKEISIIEVKEGKDIKGFKITRIDPNSKMATLGLRKNDLIVKANNVVLKSYRDALNLYANIKDIDVMQIVVIRDGVEKEIVYEIN
jgi:type II secretion system protein C